MAMAAKASTRLKFLRPLLHPNQETHSYSSSPLQISKPHKDTKSNYREQILLANLLQRYGFPQSQLHNFVKNNKSLLKFTLSDIQQSLSILLNLKLSQKSLVSILSTCPTVLDLNFLKKWEIGFSQLNIPNISTSFIHSVLEYSVKFNIQPNDLCKCLHALKDIGFEDNTIVKIVEGFPRAISMKVQEIVIRVEFLKGFRISWEEIDGVCYFYPRVLGFGVEERLRPLMEEFESLGFGVKEVRGEIIRNPVILGMEVGEMSRCLELLNNLKCRAVIMERILDMGAIRAGFEVKLRVDCLCGYGMIRREAFKVVYREPRVILYEVGDVEEKIEFLKRKMGFDVECLVEVPEYLGVNFEKQIVLRYKVLEYLRSKGGLGSEVGLKGMIKPSRNRFYNLYVKPYPECEKIFGKFSRDNVVRRKHPVGLWSMFKPQKYPETKEDVSNIKSFMESV